jgi:hypothetical protein
MDDAGFEHDVVHTNHSEAIIALETKVGVGSSTAVADSVLAGTGSGTSSWSTAPSLAGLTVDTDTLHVDATNDRVGIGTTSPSAELEVQGSSNPEIRLVSSDGTNPALYFGDTADKHRAGFYYDTSENDLLFRGYNNTTRMMIDSSGNVGIGTTSPSRTLDVRGIARVGDDTNRTPDANGVGHLMIDGNGYGGYVSLDGTAMWVGHNASSRKLYLATDETARLTVDGSGNVGIGMTSPTDMVTVGTTSNNGSFRVHAAEGSESFRVTSNIVRSYNIKNITTGLAANVYISTSNATMYRSTSSIKYKTDVETMEDSYADAILGLRPVWYRSLGQDDPDSWGYWGFIAEEVAEVDPRLVSFGVPTDYERQYDEDGEPVDPAVADLTEPEGVQYDRMVPHLVNLLKRHEARIAALEAA